MKKRQKRDPLSVLLSMRDKASAPRKATPLTSIAAEEVVAFQTLHRLLEQSKLFAYLNKKDPTGPDGRYLSIDEALVQHHYPGLDPLTGRMVGIDAFIYVYDGITSQDHRRATKPGDVRHFLGEAGFRELLLELERSCQIHRFCREHLASSVHVKEPITNKHLFDARRDAFAIHARAREVFQQIAGKILDEIEAHTIETPQVYQYAYQFAREMAQALEPLARLGKQVRSSEGV